MEIWRRKFLTEAIEIFSISKIIETCIKGKKLYLRILFLKGVNYN